jgi:hypothetical protein
MGVGASSQKSSSSESALTKQQGRILAQREQQYQQYFFPELQGMISEAKTGANQTMQRAILTPQVNQAYEAGMQKVNQAMAQRGLMGSGIETMANVDMGRRRAMDLNTLSQQAVLTNDQKRMNLIQLGLGMSPQTTTATPMTQKSSGWSVDIAQRKEG